MAGKMTKIRQFGNLYYNHQINEPSGYYGDLLRAKIINKVELSNLLLSSFPAIQYSNR